MSRLFGLRLSILLLILSISFVGCAHSPEGLRHNHLIFQLISDLISQLPPELWISQGCLGFFADVHGKVCRELIIPYSTPDKFQIWFIATLGKNP